MCCRVSSSFNASILLKLLWHLLASSQICAEVDKDHDGLLSQEEWSTAELWFQYRAAQPGALQAEVPEASGEAGAEAGTGSGSESDAGPRSTLLADGEKWPEADTVSRAGTPPPDDEQYDR